MTTFGQNESRPPEHSQTAPEPPAPIAGKAEMPEEVAHAIGMYKAIEPHNGRSGRTLLWLADALDRNRDRLDCAEYERDEIELAYREMCERLRDAVKRHDLGLGGEHLDVLVVDALDRAQRERDEANQMRSSGNQEAFYRGAEWASSELKVWDSRHAEAVALKYVAKKARASHPLPEGKL